MVKRIKKLDEAGKLEVIRAFIKSEIPFKEIKKEVRKEDLLEVICFLLKRVETLERKLELESKRGEKPLFPFVRNTLGKKTIH